MINTIKATKFAKHRVETPFITLWIEEGILYAQYIDNLHVSLEVARFCVEKRIYFSEGLSYPLLVDMRGIKSVTREARKYLATVGTTLVTAGALITGSSFNRALGNVFLVIDKPPVPTRLFTSEEKAIQWLKKFLASGLSASVT